MRGVFVTPQTVGEQLEENRIMDEQTIKQALLKLADAIDALGVVAGTDVSSQAGVAGQVKPLTDEVRNLLDSN